MTEGGEAPSHFLRGAAWLRQRALSGASAGSGVDGGVRVVIAVGKAGVGDAGATHLRPIMEASEIICYSTRGEAIRLFLSIGQAWASWAH